MKSKLFVIAVLSLFMLTACTQRIVDFTIISTKNIDISRGGDFERGRERIRGEDMVHIIFSIPTGTPELKEAIDRALESVPGAVALLDGVVYSKSTYVIIYGQMSYIIEGTPLIDPKLTDNTEYKGGYYSLEFDREGNVKARKELTKETFEARKKQMLDKGSRSFFLN